MRADRDQQIAQVAREAAGRAQDPVAAADLARVARDFTRAENVPREEFGCAKDTAIGLAIGIGAGLLVIWRWLR